MSDTDPLDDDGELELEPIDPEILEHQRRRTKEKVRDAEDAVDINAEYDEVDKLDPISLDDLKRFRFTTRHLLILTAMLAVALTLKDQFGLFITFCAALAVGWWIVQRQEKRRLAEIDRHRRQMISKTAARRAREDGQVPVQLPTEAFEKVNDEWDAAISQQPAFDFSFSMKEMFAAFTAAAVVLGLAHFLDDGQYAALLFGMIALVGLVVQAVGYEPPALLILGWWLMLVLYILLSLMGAFSKAEPVTSWVAPPAVQQDTDFIGHPT